MSRATWIRHCHFSWQRVHRHTPLVSPKSKSEGCDSIPPSPAAATTPALPGLSGDHCSTAVKSFAISLTEVVRPCHALPAGYDGSNRGDGGLPPAALWQAARFGAGVAAAMWVIARSITLYELRSVSPSNGALCSVRRMFSNGMLLLHAGAVDAATDELLRRALLLEPNAHLEQLSKVGLTAPE